ncbi:tumor necrosis factor receptor superfamily member 14-like isoform X1 [Hypomesus transpacificus]|uniref:tumor necrosis factor receptor superfamily member 14-like isoform X1 n=1 Tax=Hypomesus transpacificus TaxID=137520 RepID=UPI001F0749F6|nr:tumor necrosis factor receptor superfamily member 14-like isoform X1 [Hypomesus transpacificus]
MENYFHFQILLLFLNIGLCIACGRAEYQLGEECCPLCASGNSVHKHCTEFTSTSCIPCTGSTFIDRPNGLTSCFPCRNCDQVSGLKVKQSCTPTSNAVCEPLEGYFCAQLYNQGCKAAKEHSRCKPGQYISQQATSSKDTECSDCTGDTFSDGSLTSCQPHTKCESLDKVQVIPGDHSSDSTCETTKSGVGVLIGIMMGIAMIASFLIGCNAVCRKTQRISRAINESLHCHKHPFLFDQALQQPSFTEKEQESTDTSLLPPVQDTSV